MWSEVGNDFPATYEVVTDAFEVMRIHDRCHHLAVDGKRHIDEVALDQRRPVLVAHRMTQFNAGAHCYFGRELRQIVQIYDHHIAQVDSRNDGLGCLRIPEQHVAVADIGAAVKRNRQLGALRAGLSEAALLRLPLVDLQQIYIGGGEPLGSFRIADISQHGFNDHHGALLS